MDNSVMLNEVKHLGYEVREILHPDKNIGVQNDSTNGNLLILQESNMRKKQEKRNGFTIIEIMAVIIILGLLATVVAVNVVGKIDKARVTATKTSLKTLHNAVIQFKMDTTRYPDEEIGLQELVEEPSDVTGWEPSGYLETTEVPKDAWGNDFIYELYPESGKPFVIISYGADGEEGGEGYDEDLYSTDAD